MFEDFDAGELRQQKVEQNHVRLEVAHERKTGFASAGDFHLVTFHGEFVAIDVRQDLVVFDDEDFFMNKHPRTPRLRERVPPENPACV